MKYLLIVINFVQVFAVNIAYRVWKRSKKKNNRKFKKT